MGFAAYPPPTMRPSDPEIGLEGVFVLAALMAVGYVGGRAE